MTKMTLEERKQDAKEFDEYVNSPQHKKFIDFMGDLYHGNYVSLARKASDKDLLRHSKIKSPNKGQNKAFDQEILKRMKN